MPFFFHDEAIIKSVQEMYSDWAWSLASYLHFAYYISLLIFDGVTYVWLFRTEPTVEESELSL